METSNTQTTTQDTRKTSTIPFGYKLDEDGTTPKGELRLKAAESLLNRIGIGSRETVDHNVTAMHGVVLLPNKQDEKIINE